MELSYDWRSFQSLFYFNRRKSLKPSEEGYSESTESLLNPNQESVYLIVKDRLVLAAYSEGQDVGDWVGCSADEICSELKRQDPHRKVIVLEQKNVDQWLVESLKFNHYDEQSEFLRNKALSCVQGRHFRHFILDALASHWKKFFPSYYGIFFRVEGERLQDLLLTVRNGKIEMFHEPDLIGFSEGRNDQPAEVVRFLSEKYLIPVQGFFTKFQHWRDLAESRRPWSVLWQGIRRKEFQLVPLKWSLWVWLFGKSLARQGP